MCLFFGGGERVGVLQNSVIDVQWGRQKSDSCGYDEGKGARIFYFFANVINELPLRVMNT